MLSFSEILTLDQNLTLTINGWHTPFCDEFFFIFSRMEVWIPLFIVFASMMWREWGWRRMLFLLFWAAVVVLLADQTCNIVKYTVCRLRPTHEPSLEGMVHTVHGYLGGDYGFCSAHAANTVAITLFTSLIVRRWQYSLTMSFWVLLSCWSRMYLGVHYLGDILCGAAAGALFALLVYAVLLRKWWARRSDSLSVRSANILVYSYLATCLVISLCSLYLSLSLV